MTPQQRKVPREQGNAASLNLTKLPRTKRSRTLAVSIPWLLTLLIFAIKDIATEQLRPHVEAMKSADTAILTANSLIDIVQVHNLDTARLLHAIYDAPTPSYPADKQAEVERMQITAGVSSEKLSDFERRSLLAWACSAAIDFLKTIQGNSDQWATVRAIDSRQSALWMQMQNPNPMFLQDSGKERQFYIQIGQELETLHHRLNENTADWVLDTQDRIERDEKRILYLTYGMYILAFASAIWTLVVRLLGQTEPVEAITELA